MASGHAPFTAINRVANPVVRALLRSPLHRVASGGLVLITVTGRRTGRAHTFPVGYRQTGERLTIVVGAPGRKRWWRNVRGDGAPVSLRLRGARRTGRARAIGDERSGVRVEVELDPVADSRA